MSDPDEQLRSVQQELEMQTAKEAAADLREQLRAEREALLNRAEAESRNTEESIRRRERERVEGEFELFKQQALLRAELRERELASEQKNNFAYMLYGLLAAWLMGVWVLLWIVIYSQPIGDSVLLALLGTTTVNIIGLVYLVTRHFFPNQDGKK